MYLLWKAVDFIQKVYKQGYDLLLTPLVLTMQIFTILPMGTHTIHHYGTMYGTNNIVLAKTNLIK